MISDYFLYFRLKNQILLLLFQIISDRAWYVAPVIHLQGKPSLLPTLLIAHQAHVGGKINRADRRLTLVDCRYQPSIMLLLSYEGKTTLDQLFHMNYYGFC